MSAIDDATIKAVEKEIMESDKTLEDRINKEVEARLAKIEADKKAAEEAKAKEAEVSAKETELKNKLVEMENNQKELQKQLENISLRKSIPKDPENSAPQKVDWKDLPKDERIRLQKEFVSKTIGMNI